ncbi:MAG: CoA transferase [Deltaproteobacteria bacterium]|nr:MAG: CoA transferase [Deltaproteobacteria bacterium]
MARPLEGVRVLDLTRLLPGPFLTMVLADMGADVVKVEAPNVGDYMRQMPPSRDGLGGGFLAVNRNKRSLVLDLKTDAGRDALLRMAERADVLVETFRPGVLDRLGVGYDALRARNRGLVMCSISGYGQTGPYRDRAGHDLNYIALAGVLAMGGARGGAPALPGVQIADLAGGALWGAVATLGALVERQRTGEGAHLDISMCEGALALLAHAFGQMDAGGAVPTRGEAPLNGGLACYGVYRTRDGKYLAVGALEPKFWLALNSAIGRKADVSEVIAPPDRQAAIRAELQAIFEQHTRDEWMERLAAVDCCCEPVLELDEVRAHPLHAARGAFFTADGGALGQVLQVRTPVGEPRADRIAPRLGEHSAEVLRDYGFSEEEIAALVG